MISYFPFLHVCLGSYLFYSSFMLRVSKSFRSLILISCNSLMDFLPNAPCSIPFFLSYNSNIRSSAES